MHTVLFMEKSGEFRGGGQVSLLELIRSLDRSAFRPMALLGASGGLKEALEKADCPVTVLPLPVVRVLNAFHILRTVKAVRSVVKRNDVRLIHANDTRSHFYAGLAGKSCGVPAVFHHRVSYPDGLADRIMPFFAEGLAAVSSEVARRFPGHRNKVTVIHNAVDVGKFTADSRRLPPLLPGKSPVIGSVGRLLPEKGFDTFLEALVLLKRDFPDIGAAIAATGPDGEEGVFRRLVKEKGLDADVRLFMACPDMPAFYHGLDVFALLSRSEGHNRSILEAMASGRAVVASRVGGNLDTVRDGGNGLLVRPGDPVETAEAVRRLLKDEGMRLRLALNGRRDVVERFSLGKQAEKMGELFRSALGERVPRPGR